jgi:hypothetical protein
LHLRWAFSSQTCVKSSSFYYHDTSHSTHRLHSIIQIFIVDFLRIMDGVREDRLLLLRYAIFPLAHGFDQPGSEVDDQKLL